MDVKTILNKCQPIRPFVYGAVRLVGDEIHEHEDGCETAIQVNRA